MPLQGLLHNGDQISLRYEQRKSNSTSHYSSFQPMKDVHGACPTNLTIVCSTPSNSMRCLLSATYRCACMDLLGDLVPTYTSQVPFIHSRHCFHLCVKFGSGNLGGVLLPLRHVWVRPSTCMSTAGFASPAVCMKNAQPSLLDPQVHHSWASAASLPQPSGRGETLLGAAQ